MPDDLLRYVVGPSPLWAGWTWLAALLLVGLVTWYVFVFVSTASRQRSAPGVVQRVHAAVLRRRFTAAARRIDERFRAGELDRAAAAAALSALLRDFLQEATGERARYLQLDEFEAGELAAAAPLLQRLNDVQFNPAADEDARLGSATEELIRSWI